MPVMSNLMQLMGVSPTEYPYWDRSRTNHDQMPDWDAVQQRLVSHPEELIQPWRFRNITDPSYDNKLMFPIDIVLRISFFPPPIEIIQNFTRVYPQAISQTTLYSACNNPGTSASVFQMLLYHAPRSILSYQSLILDMELLHLAVKMGNVEIVAILIQQFPYAVSAMSRTFNKHRQSLPLHIACDGKGYSKIIPYLLEAGSRIGLGGPDGYGGMFLQDTSGYSPLDIAVRYTQTRYNESSWDVLLAFITFAQQQDAAWRSRLHGRDFSSILMAEEENSPLAQTMLFALQLNVPLSFVETAILTRCCKDDLARKDHFGMTPLVKCFEAFASSSQFLVHDGRYEAALKQQEIRIAQAAAGIEYTRFLTHQDQESGNESDVEERQGEEQEEYEYDQMGEDAMDDIMEDEDEDEENSLGDESTQQDSIGEEQEQTPQEETLWGNIFKFLASPGVLLLEERVNAASIKDNQGRLPLHIAAESHLKWEMGTQAILEANYDALGEIDPVTGLLPFMLAAVESPKDNSSNSFMGIMDTSDLNTVYSLLRGQPCEVMMGFKDINEMT